MLITTLSSRLFGRRLHDFDFVNTSQVSGVAVFNYKVNCKHIVQVDNYK